MPLEFNGFRVHIECNGEELPQFQVSEVDARTIRCYIPSEAGKNFRVIASLVNPTARACDGFIADVWAEGKLIVGEGAYPHERIQLEDVRVDATTYRPLVFTAVQTTDEERLANSIDNSSVGLLEIQMSFGVLHSEKKAPQIWEKTTSDATLLNERSKKAGFNVTTLGESTKHADASLDPVVHWEYMNKDDEPDFIFQFHHQPMAHLVASGIAPCPGPLTQSKKSESPSTSSKRLLQASTDVGDSSKRRKIRATKVKQENNRRGSSDNSHDGDDDSDLEALEAEVKAEELRLERIAAEEALQRKKAQLARARKNKAGRST